MIFSALNAFFLFSCVASALSANTPVYVNVRVEGDTSTLYDGNVLTKGHVVHPISGDNHHCDGTNNRAHPIPVPVATAALDDAAMTGNFTWNGTWTPSLDDYFMTQIASVPASPTSLQNWFLYLNYHPAQVGGCQLKVNEGDKVLWAFGPSAPIALHLDGPKEVVVKSWNMFHVTDGLNGHPIAGASVEGNRTDGNGDVWLKFSDIGMKSIKAENYGSIRSNALQVNVISELSMSDPEDQTALQ
ncbi:hypothetical protein E4T56_gene2230 [Termitomyces sp. T112]|nr:hypothetical protein E4T56_gene2230 [Termitomyces sp. T112]KAH0584867.1 hypothetical protein H2248_008145 [Termitomyces sp. 'cryptogamus']